MSDNPYFEPVEFVKLTETMKKEIIRKSQEINTDHVTRKAINSLTLEEKQTTAMSFVESFKLSNMRLDEFFAKMRRLGLEDYIDWDYISSNTFKDDF